MTDDAGYVDFVTARWSALYRLAFLLSGCPSGADDLLQTTLLKTYVAWRRVVRSGAPEAYVRRIMVNAAVSDARRAHVRRERPVGVVPDLGVGTHEEGAVDERAALWPMVVALPPRQRAVVVLRYYEGLSEAEIADVLGCAPGTVKSQASDALRALRRLVPSTAGGLS